MQICQPFGINQSGSFNPTSSFMWNVHAISHQSIKFVFLFSLTFGFGIKRTMPGKCTFKEAWLGNRQFSIWIERGKSSGQARCKVCSKDFDIQNMGQAAVKSHTKSKKHIDAVEGKHINCFSCLFVHF